MIVSRELRATLANPTIASTMMTAAVSHRAQRVSAFAGLEPGALGLVVDANGRLSLVCDRQSAATVLRVQPGDVVTLRPFAPGGGAS